jgi:ATP-dependent DNA helicase RecQ
LIHASNDQYRILGLTALGREVMAGRVEDIKMNVPVVRPARSVRRRRTRLRSPATTPDPAERPAETQPADAAVVEALRHWRREEASRRSVAAFVILHDRTLVDIARSSPRSRTELGAVKGVGPSKLAEYGDAILSVVASAAGAKVSGLS